MGDSPREVDEDERQVDQDELMPIEIENARALAADLASALRTRRLDDADMALLLNYGYKLLDRLLVRKS